MGAGKSRYYDWDKTLTRSGAFITMVVSARGFGKTYGLRKKAIQDYIKNGYTFVEVCRYQQELKGDSGMQVGYFDKLEENNEFPGWMFKITGRNGYIARDPGVPDIKPKWELLCRFVALSEMQKSKKRTWANVRKVIFDEFVIDKRTTARYLTGEVDLFINLLDSIAREIPGEGTPVRSYLLGNACDLGNPYFVRWGISKQPKAGYHWYNGKTVLLHYADDPVYSEGKRDTMVGKLVAGTKEEQVIIGNMFSVADTYDIQQKPAWAQPYQGVKYLGKLYGIWLDMQQGYYYVTDGFPEKCGEEIIALTREDNSANIVMAKRADKRMRAWMDMYTADCMRFDTVGTREGFLAALNAFGIR